MNEIYLRDIFTFIGIFLNCGMILFLVLEVRTLNLNIMNLKEKIKSLEERDTKNKIVKLFEKGE